MSSNMNLPPDVVISWFPENRNKALMTDMDFYITMATNLGFSVIDGQSRVTKNGDVIKNPVTLAPLDPKQVVQDYFAERNWMMSKPESNGVKTMTEFRNIWTDKNPGKDPNGPEFQKAVSDHANSNKEFNWYD